MLDKQTAEFDRLTEKTIAVHDELMEEMGTIMDLSMEIDTRLNSESVEEDYMTDRLTAAKESLNNAHDGMMDWMKNYSENFPYEAESPSTTLEFEEKMPLLESYYLDIQDLKKETNQAIKEGEEVLEATS